MRNQATTNASSIFLFVLSKNHHPQQEEVEEEGKYSNDPNNSNDEYSRSRQSWRSSDGEVVDR
jgi:hypothetical protein